MDALSLLTSSVPSYFVIGPLAIVLLVLIVMIGKKDKPVETTPTAPQAPAAEVAPTPTQLSPQPEAAAQSSEGWHSAPPKEVTQSAQPVIQQTPEIPAQAPGMVAGSSLPPVTPNPLPMEHMPQQPELVINHPPEPPSPASIPPISSWKPSPSPTASSEVLGESEAALQAHAIVQEPSVAPSTQATESIQEPAPQIEVPQPASTDQNPSNVAPTASV